MQANSMFKVNIINSASTKLGYQVTITIQITQHSNNLLLLEKIQTFLNMGKIYLRKDRDAADLKINNLKHANGFIHKFKSVAHNLSGAKALDYLDFCKIINLINEKLHLTQEGLNKIKEINSNVNNQRKF